MMRTYLRVNLVVIFLALAHCGDSKDNKAIQSEDSKSPLSGPRTIVTLDASDKPSLDSATSTDVSNDSENLTRFDANDAKTQVEDTRTQTVDTTPSTDTSSDTTTQPPKCGTWTVDNFVESTPVDAQFPAGFSSGVIRATSAVLWTYTATPQQIVVHYSEGPDCEELTSEPIETTNAEGRVAHILVTGLTPNTRYRYRFEIIGGQGPSSAGWFITAPDDKNTPFRLAFSGDIKADNSFYDLIDDLIASGADAYLSLGDWPYADHSSPAVTLEEYRQKHKKSRKYEVLQALLRYIPMLGTWDDHEIVNDWDGSDAKSKPERVAAGMKAWKEWFPHAQAIPGEIYRSYPWGPGVELFQLDCRSHRDANSAPNDANKTMLGETQLDWLLTSLSESSADFKLILTSVPLDYGTTGADHWVGFLYERESIVDHIVDNGISGVLFLTADQHWLAVHHFQSGLKQFQTGPLATTTRTPSANVPPWVLLQAKETNFGLLDYQPGNPATLTFTAVGFDSQVLYKETLSAGRGAIEVKPSTPNAQWTIGGAHTFVGKGPASFSLASPGNYTISWKGLDGTPAPAPQTLALKDGDTIVFEGDYESAATNAVFLEPFSKNSLSPIWTTVDQGQDDKTSNWKIKNGAATETGNAYDINKDETVIEKLGTFQWAKNVAMGDGTLTAEIYPGDNDGFGLMYGIQSENTYYRFSLDHERSFARLVRVNNGNFVVLAEDLNYVFPLNSWLTVTVQRNGNLHTLSVNGNPVLSAQDGNLASGSIGLYSWGMDDVRFDNVAIFP